jgi:type VI secretion system secreted protein VgrG
MTELSLQDLIGGHQHNRILRLSFPKDDGPKSQLLVNKLDAWEGLSRGYKYTLELLAHDARLELKALQGKLFCVELVRQDGTLRYFTGYCFSFCLKKVDGGLAFYEAELGPWLKFLSLRKDNYLFHNETLYEQTSSIFSDYGVLPDWDWRVASSPRAESDACQFDETDHNYLSRRWEAAGLLYWYEHSENGHKLILADDSTRAQSIDGKNADIPFQRQGGSAEENGIGEWSPKRSIIQGSVTVATFDFTNPGPNFLNRNTILTLNRQGEVPNVESYEYAGGLETPDGQDRERRATQDMEKMEAVAKHFDGVSNNRYVMAGRSFHLTEHFDNNDNKYGQSNKDVDQNEFLILEAHHLATNNYLQQSDAKAGYSNRMSCSRKAIRWRPGRSFDSVETKIYAPQTATVVGPKAGNSVHVDEYGRVRVQFHWDRVGEYNDGSSAWIRTVNLWAGGQLGASAIHRVGSEVCVLFMDGNPDSPVIIAGIPNALHLPPWSLPSQKALTGLRSRELTPDGGNSAAGRSNHLILDDTHERIQAQLKSDHAHSQLSLGHITRIEDASGRKDERGEGWELATDAWGVARAGKGMLLTTEARTNAASHIKDMDETVQRLASASTLHGALADMARESGAQDGPGQADVAKTLGAQTAAIQGSAKCAFPELSQPHLVIASPAGIELTTAQSVHIASDNNVAITTGKNFSIASRDSLYASVGNTFSLFVHKGNLKMISAMGKVMLQAQRDELTIIAQKVLALLSESDWIDIRGKKGVRLHGANAMLEIGEQTQFCTPSPVLFHGNLETLPPKTVSQAVNERPNARFDQEVFFLDTDHKPVANHAFQLIHEDGHRIDSKTTASGTSHAQKGTGLDSYTIRYKGELP